MLQEPEEVRGLFVVRDGQRTVVTCDTCGCRLQADLAADDAWRHFGSLGGHDAQGHAPSCVDLPHDASGRVAILA